MKVCEGYDLNYKLLAMQTGNHQGSLPAEHSFLAVKAENVVLTALKKAEDDDDLVLRFYEWAGKDTSVAIQLPPGTQTAHDADLMERPTDEILLRDDVVDVHARPYEIKTVRIRFALPPILPPVQVAK